MMFSKIISLYHILKIAANPKNNIKSVIHVGNKVGKWKSTDIASAHLYKNEEFKKMRQKEYGINALQLKDFVKYKEGTLGHAFYNFYARKGLDVYPGNTTIGNSDNDYVIERIRKSHDFIHLVMGYDTNEEGEALVNAFVFNQTRLPYPLLIMISIIMKTLVSKPKRFYPLFQQIIDVWKESNETNEFLLFKWEEMLDQPLANVVSKFKNKERVNKFITPIDSRPPLVLTKLQKYGSSIFENQILRPPLLR